MVALFAGRSLSEKVIVMALSLSLRNGSAFPFRFRGNRGSVASAEPPNRIKCVTESRRHSARMVAKPMPQFIVAVIGVR
jgi:hypothetical protein